jgi:hypothetical protein
VAGPVSSPGRKAAFHWNAHLHKEKPTMHPDRIRFRADSDDATRTIKTYRQIWKHKPASARGRGWGKHGEWQTRTPSFTVNGELIRTTEKDLALLPLTPEAAVQRFTPLRGHRRVHDGNGLWRVPHGHRRGAVPRPESGRHAPGQPGPRRRREARLRVAHSGRGGRSAGKPGQGDTGRLSATGGLA